MNKIKFGLISLLIAFAGMSFGVATVSASTASQDACKGLAEINPSQTCGAASDKGVNGIIRTVINTLSFIIGVAAVIMVIIAGFKYITAGGDSNSIGSAKNTLVYALVGLAIAALAQVLVHFVLDVSSDAANGKVTQLQTAGRSLEAA